MSAIGLLASSGEDTELDPELAEGARWLFGVSTSKARTHPGWQGTGKLSHLLASDIALWNLPIAVLELRGPRDTLVHWHVPKTAGSDLASNMAESASLSYNHALVLVRESRDAGARYVAESLQSALEADSYLLTGHFDLYKILRPLEEFRYPVVTVIREPVERYRSHVDWDLRFEQAMLGSMQGRAGIMHAESRKTAANFMTHGLVGYGVPTADAGRSAFDRMRGLNIEVVDYRRYDKWFENRFGFQSQHLTPGGERLVPDPVLKAIPPWTGEELAVLCRAIQGDLILYDRITEMISPGAPSISF